MKMILLLVAGFVAIPPVAAVVAAPSGAADNVGAHTSGIAPTSGSIAGGDVITVYGQFFDETTYVRVRDTNGGDWSAAPAVALVSDSELRFTMPAHAAGVVSVVACEGGVCGYNVLPTFEFIGDSAQPSPSPSPTAPVNVIPNTISISPTSGSIAGGDVVTVYGQFFDETTYVNLRNFSGDGWNAAVSVTLVSDRELRFTTPAHDAGVVVVLAMERHGTDAPVGGYNEISTYEFIEGPSSLPVPAPIVSVPADDRPSAVPTMKPTLPAPVPSNTAGRPSDSPRKPKADNVVAVSSNARVSVRGDSQHLLVDTPYNVERKYVLRERRAGKWIKVDKSYPSWGTVVFEDAQLRPGATYKVTVKVNDRRRIAAWFTAPS